MRHARWSAESCRGEGGQAVPLLVALLAVGMVGVIAVGQLARGAVEAAAARTAADAAALAGVTGGRRAAAEAAGHNGGRLVSFRQLGSDVVVEVAVGDARAAARATLRSDVRGP